MLSGVPHLKCQFIKIVNISLKQQFNLGKDLSVDKFRSQSKDSHEFIMCAFGRAQEYLNKGNTIYIFFLITL